MERVGKEENLQINDGRVIDGGDQIYSELNISDEQELTEAQVVEMPDGQLKLFMRNRNKFVKVATSCNRQVEFYNFR